MSYECGLAFRVFVLFFCLSLNQTDLFNYTVLHKFISYFSFVFCVLLAHTYAIHSGILQPLPSLNGKQNNGSRATVPRQLIQFCSPCYHNGHMRSSEILSVTLKRMSQWSQKPALASLRPHKRKLGSQTQKI